MLLPPTITDTQIHHFQHALKGSLIRPGEAQYDHLRAAFNRYGSPAFIVQVKNSHDVVKAIEFAKEHNLTLSIRSGGHGLNGAATNDGGVVIDLSHLRSVTVIDESSRRVRIETGAVWGEVAQTLHQHGLALTSGDTATVGVGGLVAGGGIGWLVRKYGLTIDNIVSAEIITADGQILTVSEQQEPDLFWAIRGGGGNFGVITAIEAIAHPEPNVVFGTLAFNASQDANNIITGWRDFMRTASTDIVSHLFVVPQTLTKPAAISMAVCFSDADAVTAEAILKPLTELGPLIEQQFTLSPYSAILPYYGRAQFGQHQSLHRNQFMPELTDEVVGIIATEFTKPAAPMLQMRFLGGAMNQVSPEATAFAHRNNEALLVAMQFPGGERSLATAWQKVQPFGSGSYVNFLDGTDEASARLAYPPATYERLKKIKQQYDPTNLFRNNVNIAP